MNHTSLIVLYSIPIFITDSTHMGKKKSKKDESGDPFFDPSEWEEVVPTETPADTLSADDSKHQPITLSVDALLRELRESDHQQPRDRTTDPSNRPQKKDSHHEKTPYAQADEMAMKEALPISIDLSSVDIYNVSDLQALLQRYKNEYRDANEEGTDATAASNVPTVIPSQDSHTYEVSDAASSAHSPSDAATPTPTQDTTQSHATPSTLPSSTQALRAALWAEDISDMSAEEYFLRMRVEAALADEALMRGRRMERMGEGKGHAVARVKPVQAKEGVHALDDEGGVIGDVGNNREVTEGVRETGSDVPSRKRPREAGDDEEVGGRVAESESRAVETGDALAILGAMLHAHSVDAGLIDGTDESLIEVGAVEEETISEGDTDEDSASMEDDGSWVGLDDEDLEEDAGPVSMYIFPSGTPHTAPSALSVPDLAARFSQATDTSQRTVALPTHYPRVGVAVAAERDAAAIATQAQQLHGAYIAQRGDLYAAGERLLRRVVVEEVLPQLAELRRMAEACQALYEAASARVQTVQSGAQDQSMENEGETGCPASVKACFPALFQTGVADSDVEKDSSHMTPAVSRALLSLPSPRAAADAVTHYLTSPALHTVLVTHYSRRAPSVAEILSGAGPSAPQAPPFELLQCLAVAEGCLRVWRTACGYDSSHFDVRGESSPGGDRSGEDSPAVGDDARSHRFYPFRARDALLVCASSISDRHTEAEAALTPESVYAALCERFRIPRVPEFYVDGRLTADVVAERERKKLQEGAVTAAQSTVTAPIGEVHDEVTEANEEVAEADDGVVETGNDEMPVDNALPDALETAGDMTDNDSATMETNSVGEPVVDAEPASASSVAANDIETTTGSTPAAKTSHVHLSVSSTGLLRLATEPRASAAHSTTTINDLALGSLPCVSFLDANHPCAPFTAMDVLDGTCTVLARGAKEEDSIVPPALLPTLLPTLSTVLQLDQTSVLKTLILLTDDLHETLQTYTNALQILPKRNKNQVPNPVPTTVAAGGDSAAESAPIASPHPSSSFSDLPALPTALFRLDAAAGGSPDAQELGVGSFLPLLTACATTVENVHFSKHMCSEVPTEVRSNVLETVRQRSFTDVLLQYVSLAKPTGELATLPATSTVPKVPTLTLCQSMQLHALPLLSPAAFSWLYALLLCCETPLNADAAATVNVLFRCLALLRWLADSRQGPRTSADSQTPAVNAVGGGECSECPPISDVTLKSDLDITDIYAPYRFYTTSAQEEDYISSLYYLLSENTRNQCHVLLQLIRTRMKQGYPL